MKKITLLTVVVFFGILDASCCKKTCIKVNRAAAQLEKAAEDAMEGVTREKCETCRDIHNKLTDLAAEARKCCKKLDDCYERCHTKKTSKKRSCKCCKEEENKAKKSDKEVKH